MENLRLSFLFTFSVYVYRPRSVIINNIIIIGEFGERFSRPILVCGQKYSLQLLFEKEGICELREREREREKLGKWFPPEFAAWTEIRFSNI